MKLTLTTKAYAKINLYLDVGEKRADGYHEITSVMQEVSLYDNVTVSADTDSNERKITLSCSELSLPTDERNIAFRAAAAFLDKYSIDCDVAISIDKRIPIAGGLAGGSTDGAAVLKLLNSIFKVNASEAELCALGKVIGADIPFCIIGGTCIAQGIGELLTPIDARTKYHILICNSGASVSTGEAYNALDSTSHEGYKPKLNDITENLKNGIIPKDMYNSFERVIFPLRRETEELKNKLKRLGAVSALMSGSGPSVFGLFDNEALRDTAAYYFTEKGIKAFPCECVHK